MKNEIQQNTPPIQSLPQTPPVIPPKPSINWSKILLFTVLGLVVVAVAVFIGIQIGKNQTSNQQPIVVQPTVQPTTDSTASWKTYTDEAFSLYTIKYPNAWFKLQKPYVDTEPLFSNYNSFQPTNSKDEIRFAITVYSSDSYSCQPIDNDGGCKGRFDKEYSLKDNTTVTSQLGQKGPTESTKITNLSIDGKPAVKSLSAISPTAINLTYQVQNQNNNYIFGFFFNNKDTLDKNMDLCDQILSTFKFTN